MAFYLSGQQVRLRLSRYAEEVIQNDMSSFQSFRINSFINAILENYHREAQASISLRLEEYEAYLESIIKNSEHSKINKENMTLLLNAEQSRLETLANSYDRPGKGCRNNPIRLRNDFYGYLTDEYTGSRENEYNNYTLPKYLRTILEEYTRLPYIKREQIYYKDKINVIQDAINLQCQVHISISSGKEIKDYHVLPYKKIMEDPLSTASYLVGYAYPHIKDKASMKACSFRIATIKDARIEKSRSGYIHPNKVYLLEKK